MKVLHVSTSKTWRGGEQQLAYLMEMAKGKGLNQVLVAVKNSPISKKARALGIPCFYGKKRSSISLAFALKIKTICEQEHIDMIHTHDAHGHSFAVWSAQLFGNTCPIVVSRRVDFPIKQKFLSQLKYNHLQVKKIICVSEAVKCIAEPSIQRPERLVTIHSGIDVQKFDFKPSNRLRADFELPDDTWLIGNVSALAPHKDYFTFLEAACIFMRKHPTAPVKFFIIGDGKLRKQLQLYATKLGIRSHVIFTGFRSDILTILKELNTFLITSKTEGLGTTIIDAMACNVPVVATEAGGIPELIIHQKTGLLAPVGDAEQLANYCHHLFEQEDLRKQLTENAIRHIAHFTKESMTDATLKVYREVHQAERKS